MISDSVIEMVESMLNGSMSSKSVNERAAGCAKHQLGAIFRRNWRSLKKGSRGTLARHIHHIRCQKMRFYCCISRS